MIDYARWLYQWFRGEILAIPGRVIALIFVLTLFLFPLITTQPYILRILIMAGLFSIYAASWDVLGGFTGQVNLGHSLFFGVAAYAAALLNLRLSLPPYLTIPLGGVFAVGAGLIIGLPALRVRGFYLSLVTLAFPIILTGIVFIFPGFTGGELGIYGVESISESRVLDYYVVLLVMLICLTLMYKFTDAKSKIIRTGLILHAIREDEISARMSGINTTRYKLLAFCVSGFFAGIAGGIYAHFLKIAGPSSLDLFFSFQAILWSIFGGMGTIYGAVVGVFILYPVLELSRLQPVLEEIRFIIFGLILILTLFFMPEGLSVWILDKIEIVCPRCKIKNVFTRKHCRACRAPISRKRSDPIQKEGDIDDIRL